MAQLEAADGGGPAGDGERGREGGEVRPRPPARQPTQPGDGAAAATCRPVPSSARQKDGAVL